MIHHPAVQEVAVVGAPHDQDGEHPTAFVVLINPQDECESLLEEIKIFTNGTSIYNNYLYNSIDLYIDIQKEFQMERRSGEASAS